METPQKQSSKIVPILIIVVVILAIGVGIYAGVTYECPLSKNINTNETVVNKNLNANVVKKAITFPDAEVAVDCEQNDDCGIADTTESLSDCCPTPDCRNWYTEDKYKAVNKDSYDEKSTDLAQKANCDIEECPQLTLPYCPPGQPYAVAECQNSVCAKVIKNSESSSVDTSDWQTYENDEWGFSIKYPADWTQSTYGQMVNLHPADREFSFEGGAAYPIYFSFNEEAINVFLQNIEDGKKSAVKVDIYDAILVDGYFETSYYAIDIAKKRGTLTINDHITNLQQAGNYDSDYTAELRNIFNAMLDTFVIF